MEKIEVDELVFAKPEVNDIDIEVAPDKERRVTLHGALEDGTRFRITFKGKFWIKYETYDKKTKDYKVPYDEFCSVQTMV